MELDAFLLVKEPFNETSGYINQPLDDKVRLNAALSNFMWEEADACTKNHTGMIHIHKTIETIQTDCPLFVEEVCSNIDENVVGVYMNDVIYEPSFYQTMAKMIDQDMFPIYNVIWFGLYPLENVVGAYTDGLEKLGYHEVEVSSIGEPMAVLDFIKDTALYVIMNNMVFKDGETIGLTIEQVLTIHLGESEIFDTPTFRIDDPFLTNL